MAMRVVGPGHRLPAHATVREEPGEYVIRLDVSDFAESELSVEAVGPRLTVRGEQAETTEDDGRPFRLRERLEESFRLPDDTDPDLVTAQYVSGTLELRAPRTRLVPRAVPIEHPAFRVDPGAQPC